MKVAIVDACTAPESNYYDSCAKLITRCLYLLCDSCSLTSQLQITRLDRPALDWDLHAPKYDVRKKMFTQVESCCCIPSQKPIPRPSFTEVSEQQKQKPQKLQPYTPFVAEYDLFFVVGDAHATPWSESLKPINCLIRHCITQKKHMLLVSDCAFESLVFILASGLKSNVVVSSPPDLKNTFLQGPSSNRRRNSLDPLWNLGPAEVRLDPIQGMLYALEPGFSSSHNQQWFKYAHTGLKNYEQINLQTQDQSKSFAINLYKSSVAKVKNELECNFRQDHFLFQSIDTASFFVEQRSKWEVMNHRLPEQKFQRLARSSRGACIIQYKNIVALHFLLEEKYPTTLLLLKNFIKEYLRCRKSSRPLRSQKRIPQKQCNQTDEIIFEDAAIVFKTEDGLASNKIYDNAGASHRSSKHIAGSNNKSNYIRSLLLKVEESKSSNNIKSKKNAHFVDAVLPVCDQNRRCGFWHIQPGEDSKTIQRQSRTDLKSNKNIVIDTPASPLQSRQENSESNRDKRNTHPLNVNDQSFWNAPIIDCSIKRNSHNYSTNHRNRYIKATPTNTQYSKQTRNSRNKGPEYTDNTMGTRENDQNLKPNPSVSQGSNNVKPILVNENLFRYKYRENTPKKWTGTHNFKIY